MLPTIEISLSALSVSYSEFSFLILYHTVRSSSLHGLGFEYYLRLTYAEKK